MAVFRVEKTRDFTVMSNIHLSIMRTTGNDSAKLMLKDRWMCCDEHIQMGEISSTASFRDFQRPEYALKYFIRLVVAKVSISYSMDIITTIYTICGGVVESIADSHGGIGGAAVEDAGF